MPILAKVIVSNPKTGKGKGLGEYTFAALPNLGDIVDAHAKTKNGGSVTPYIVVLIRHLVGMGDPDVTVIVERWMGQ